MCRTLCPVVSWNRQLTQDPLCSAHTPKKRHTVDTFTYIISLHVSVIIFDGAVIPEVHLSHWDEFPSIQNVWKMESICYRKECM